MKEKNVSIKVWINIISAVLVMIYFISIYIVYNNANQNQVMLYLKIASMIIMSISIIIFEVAYKKDSGVMGIAGIEILVIALHTLSIIRIVSLSNFDFRTYIVSSSYIFALYYVMKSLLIYTKEKRAYLKGLCDIKDIVVNEPLKKEAKRSSLDNKTK